MPQDREKLSTWVQKAVSCGCEMWITFQESRRNVEKYVLGNFPENKIGWH